jgi:ribose transport system substrate-binding protein
MKELKLSLAALALVATMTAACSSGDADSSNAAPDAESRAGVEAAEAAVEEYLKEPTEIPLTEPLKSKPATGETFVYIKCDQSQCVQQAEAIQEATDALGWEYRDVPFQAADPATLVSAMKQALELDPVAVGIPSQPQAVWQGVIPDYMAAGVPIVSTFVGPMEYDDTVIGQIGADQTKYGEMLANWVIADSGGQAHVVYQTVSAFTILDSNAKGFTDTMEENCPDCTVTIVDNTVPQLGAGQVTSTVVAAVQKDPKINYVVAGNGPFLTGLVPALNAAGLSDRVKIAGGSGDTTNLTNVKAGQEHASTGTPIDYAQWLMIDLVLRHLQGMDFDQAVGSDELPTQLLTNDVDFEISTSYNKPADWQEQMKELWQLP